MPKAGIYDYPLFDLDFVFDKLRQAYNTTKTDETDREIFAEVLGMSARGGGFAALVSAMEKYNLINTGRGKITITEVGKLALFGLPAEVERAKAEAVSNVTLFREVFQQYGKDATEEQFRAFLRQKAGVDVSKVQNVARDAFKVYSRVSGLLGYADTIVRAPASETTGDTGAAVMPRESTTVTPLKIQYGDIFIQVPPNDIRAIQLAIQALKFMEDVLQKEQKEKEAKASASQGA